MLQSERLPTKYEAETMDRWRRETENASPMQEGKKEKRKKDFA